MALYYNTPCSRLIEDIVKPRLAERGFLLLVLNLGNGYIPLKLMKVVYCPPPRSWRTFWDV